MDLLTVNFIPIIWKAWVVSMFLGKNIKNYCKEGQWKLCRQLYIEDLVIYPVHIQIKDTIQDDIILESDVPTEEFYEKEQEFYDIFYQGM